MPFSKYITDHSCRIAGQPSKYDATETTDLDMYEMLMGVTRAQREDIKLQRHARLHFGLFVDVWARKDLLDGSAAEFGVKFDRFITDLKRHMLELSSLEEFNLPKSLLPASD